MCSCSKKSKYTYVVFEEVDYESKEKIVDLKRKSITKELREYKGAVYINNKNGYCCLRSIDSGAFKGLEKVKYIYFDNNCFSDSSNLEEFNHCVNIEKIFMPNNNLTRLPFWNLPHLKRLFLYSNAIDHLSNEIGGLKSLEYLNLSNNKLVSLPDSLMSLPRLDTLDISGMNFKFLSKNLKLPDLRSLSMRGDSLIDLHGIKEYTSIENLDLGNNQIKEIPAEIESLKDLKTLDVSRNLLSNLPENISKLKKLKFLYLSGNKFTSFPEVLLRMPNLEIISFWKNQVQISEEEKKRIRKCLPNTEIEFREGEFDDKRIEALRKKIERSRYLNKNK